MRVGSSSQHRKHPSLNKYSQDGLPSPLMSQQDQEQFIPKTKQQAYFMKHISRQPTNHKIGTNIPLSKTDDSMKFLANTYISEVNNMMKNMVKQNQTAIAALQNQNKFIIQHMSNVSKLVHHLTNTQPISLSNINSMSHMLNSTNGGETQKKKTKREVLYNNSSKPSSKFRQASLDFQDQIDNYYQNYNVFQQDENDNVKIQHFDKKSKSFPRAPIKNVQQKIDFETQQLAKKQLKIMKKIDKPSRDYRLYPNFLNPYSIYLGSIRYQRESFLVQQGYVLDFLNKYLKQNVIATPNNPQNSLGKKQIMELYQKWKELYKYKNSQEIKQAHIQAILTNQIKGMFQCLCGKTGFIGLSFKVDQEQLKTINSVYNQIKNANSKTNPNINLDQDKDNLQKSDEKHDENSQQKKEYVEYE